MHVGLRVDIGFRLELRDNRKYRFDGIVKYVVKQALSVLKTGNMHYLEYKYHQDSFLYAHT